MSIIKKTVKYYKDFSLITKIRLSYLILAIPMLFFIFFSIYNMWSMTEKYDEMINSTIVASEFSFDFKKDLDYETYLVIVGNKSYKESGIEKMLSDAENIVSKLESMDVTDDNYQRLISVEKYLINLRTYLSRIEENSNNAGDSSEDLYEKNMQIWENDVQIVTTLVRDSIFEYIYYEVKYIQSEKQKIDFNFRIIFSVTLILLVIVSAVMIFFYYYLPLSITRPIKQIIKVTNEVASGDLSVRSDVNDGFEAKNLSKSLNTMIDKINELLKQVTKEQVRLRKAEFELLQSQINPHFLYNTLDAIVWLAESGDKEKVVSTVKSLSDFFRASLNQGKDIVTIKEELVHIKSYLEIQQVRYQDILEYEINVPEELNGYLIPKITIQPLVENALYHGIKNKRGGGKIFVGGEKKENEFVIYVKDNGQGITEDRLKIVMRNINNRAESEKSSFGLYNVNERIKLNFGDEYGISFDSHYLEGTIVTIKLPLKES